MPNAHCEAITAPAAVVVAIGTSGVQRRAHQTAAAVQVSSRYVTGSCVGSSDRTAAAACAANSASRLVLLTTVTRLFGARRSAAAAKATPAAPAAFHAGNHTRGSPSVVAAASHAFTAAMPAGMRYRLPWPRRYKAP